MHLFWFQKMVNPRHCNWQVVELGFSVHMIRVFGLFGFCSILENGNLGLVRFLFCKLLYVFKSKENKKNKNKFGSFFFFFY